MNMAIGDGKKIRVDYPIEYFSHGARSTFCVPEGSWQSLRIKRFLEKERTEVENESVLLPIEGKQTGKT